MEDNSDGCEAIVNTMKAISKFGHKFYILSYLGLCQRSAPINSPILDV